jgi:hypothetical protein
VKEEGIADYSCYWTGWDHDGGATKEWGSQDSIVPVLRISLKVGGLFCSDLLVQEPHPANQLPTILLKMLNTRSWTTTSKRQQLHSRGPTSRHRFTNA